MYYIGALLAVSILVPCYGLTNSIFKILNGNPPKRISMETRGIHGFEGYTSLAWSCVRFGAVNSSQDFQRVYDLTLRFSDG